MSAEILRENLSGSENGPTDTGQKREGRQKNAGRKVGRDQGRDEPAPKLSARAKPGPGWRQFVSTAFSGTSRPRPVCGGRCCRAHLSLLQRRGTVLAVPEGRRRIAQHLSAGYAAIPSASPAGTTESHRQAGAAVPVGTWFFPHRRPSTEVLGYSQASLRDRKNWAGCCKKLRCARCRAERHPILASRHRPG